LSFFTCVRQIGAAPTIYVAITAALVFATLAPAPLHARAATNDLTSAIQRGLFEEEANQNLGAAIQAYQAVANQFDKDRKLAATAIFRLGECYRKQGNTNEAAAQYERVLREFTDQPTLVTLSRQYLAALGSAPVASAVPLLPEAARQEQKRLIEEEMELIQKQLDWEQKQVQAGVSSANEMVTTERQLLQLKRQSAGLDAGQPASMAPGGYCGRCRRKGRGGVPHAGGRTCRVQETTQRQDAPGAPAKPSQRSVE
jgi:tetratricopeptide (TPR) repeat protein